MSHCVLGSNPVLHCFVYIHQESFELVCNCNVSELVSVVCLRFSVVIKLRESGVQPLKYLPFVFFVSFTH